MKKDWVVKKLGEVCEIDLGRTPSRGNKSFWDTEKTTNNVWLSIADLLNGDGQFVSDSKEYVSDKGAKICKVVKTGTLLVSFKLTLGRLAFAARDLFTNEAIAALPIKNEKLLSKEYLYYYLSYFDWTSASDGDIKIKGRTLNKEKLKEIQIPLPPLPEQHRIVGILGEALDTIATVKENAEKNLQNAREIFASYLQSVFANPGDGWEEKSLEELGNITSSKRIFKSEYVKEGVPFYRTKEIKELANGKSISLELFISRTRYNEIKANFGVPKEGDILLSAIGTIGEIYVVQKNNEFYFKDGNIVWLKNFDSVDTYYLKYALQSFVEQIKILSRGAAYSALTIEKLNKYRVPIASVKEQKRIVTKLDSLLDETKKLEAIYEQKLSNLDKLKKSVLQRAFNGELSGE